MNLRCIYCQTPFTLGRAEMLTAIIHMNEKNMNHYDAHCPRCRRANSISRQRMELFYPNWQEAAKQQAAAPIPPPPPPAAITPASASMKTEPLPKTVKPAPAKKLAPKKAPATKKTAAKPTVKAKKPAATKSKPAAKKAPTGKKAPVKGRKK